MILDNKKMKILFDGGGSNYRLTGIINRSTGSSLKALRGSEEFIIGIIGAKSKYFALPASGFEMVAVDEKTAYRGAKTQDNKYIESARIKYRLGYEAASAAGMTGMEVTVHYYLDDVTATVKKYLEIATPDTDAVIAFVDLGAYKTPPETEVFSAPVLKKSMQIPAYINSLGQPVYAGGFFMGYEFPTADNKVEGGVTKFRLYLGKPFEQLTKNGVFTTDEFVIGVSDGDTNADAKKAFFAYVEKIARPAKFRVQFNSWYDNMLDINSQNLKASFVAVDKGLRGSGFRSLDCFVADDGWVDYFKDEFWAFDEAKFPEGFKNEAELTQKLGSSFGVWFGPRGGYTQQQHYSQIMKQLGYGQNKQSKDICTGDTKYINNLIGRMAEMMREYGVTYFKIDGFASKACKNPDHGHPVGGCEDMFFYTHHWKEWTKGFERLRQYNPDVFLNVTSYSHPSPWFLKWADAIWINNSSDIWYEGKGSDLEQMLNYRDGRYHEFYETRKMQCPSAYIYNHEPCYAEKNVNFTVKGNKEPVKFTNEEFIKYMYICMMRGTGIQELYFSPSMFDEKRWKIAADILKFGEANFNILKNMSYFGGYPASGSVYGYMGYDGDCGLMLVRNPSADKKECVFNVSDLYGEESSYEIIEIYPGEISADSVPGDGYKIQLNPYDAKIFKITLKEYAPVQEDIIPEKTDTQTIFDEVYETDEGEVIENKFSNEPEEIEVEFTAYVEDDLD